MTIYYHNYIICVDEITIFIIIVNGIRLVVAGVATSVDSCLSS